VTPPAQAMREFFKEKGINHKAKYLSGDTGLIIPYFNQEIDILLSIRKQRILELADSIEIGQSHSLSSFKSHSQKNKNPK